MSLSLALYGDSNLRNLHAWCAAQADPACVSCLTLGASSLGYVAFDGVGGRKASSHHSPPSICRESPDVLVLHLGTCDVLRGADALSTANAIWSLARSCLTTLEVRHVVISGVLPLHTFPHLLPMVTSINSRLCHLARSTTDVSVVLHRRFSRSRFRADGVHLNEQGLCRFYRSIRGAVLRALPATLRAIHDAYCD